MSTLKIHPALAILSLFAMSAPAARSEVEYIPFPTKEEVFQKHNGLHTDQRGLNVSGIGL
ncbi:hypothetical protein [Prochlorococcus marinus]|uniref:Uncharacterized protein n=1 Tax=Prochlorococcus marinus (strain MIT 9303) TaxID=59922 RepID=A2C6C1_PROM3|nr:hypothetical protein [Prochlorococcus marinus]ABM77031.1 Hypothetical protein P9303_02761 [Prochlorococcus marinus str. MIT 9303]